MKYNEIQNKEIVELEQLEKDLRVKLGKFRFELANKALKNFSQIGKIRKDIARVLTEIKTKKK